MKKLSFDLLMTQTLICFQTEDNTSLISVYENNKWTIYRDVKDVDVLSGSTKANWSEPIDGLGFFDDIIVIFQGSSSRKALQMTDFHLIRGVLHLSSLREWHLGRGCSPRYPGIVF